MISLIWHVTNDWRNIITVTNHTYIEPMDRRGQSGKLYRKVPIRRILGIIPLKI